MSRLAVLHIDSAERDVIDELIAEGRLPNLAMLVNDGVRIDLQAPDLFRSEYTPTEFVTGQRSGTTGYWSTVTFDPADYRVSTVGSAVRTPWYGRADLDVVQFDLPHAVIDDDVGGIQVVGWGGHDARHQYHAASTPAPLLDEINRRFGPCPADAVEFTGDWHQPDYIRRLGASLSETVTRRTEILMWLLTQNPSWNLLLAGFPEVHSAGHSMAHGFASADHPMARVATAPLARATLSSVYTAVDSAVGRIRTVVGDDTIVATCAVKGMRPNRDDLAAGVLVSELLSRDSGAPPAVVAPNRRLWAMRGCPAVSPSTRSRVGKHTAAFRGSSTVRSLRRRTVLAFPESLRSGLRSVRSGRRTAPPVDADVGAAPTPASGPVSGNVDWHQSLWTAPNWPRQRCFAIPSFSDAHLRLNLADRERDGIVAADDYDAECDRLEALLRAATDPRTGEPIVERVDRPRRHDPMAPGGPVPDLVVCLRNPVDALDHPDLGQIGPFAQPRAGSHTTNGFLFAAGADLAPSRIGVRPTIDLAPTLLRLLGRTVPTALDGRPVELETSQAG